MIKKINNSWGEKIWEEKIKRQNERGVIHGGRFSDSKEITSKQIKETMKYLDKEILPKITKKGNVMDAGVGPLARFAIEFSKRGYDVTGVDVSKTTIGYAKKHAAKQNAKGISFIQDDLTELKKVNKKFDFIFCFGTFGHIPKILALETLRNFNSKLNKNGLCLVHFWIENPSSVRKKLKEAGYMWLHNINANRLKSFYVNCSYYSLEEVKSLLERSNFKLINEGEGDLFLLRKVS